MNVANALISVTNGTSLPRTLSLSINRIISMGRRPLMGGNWKLNPRKVSDAVGLATEVCELMKIINLDS